MIVYEIIVPYATENTSVMYKYYWWDKQWHQLVVVFGYQGTNIKREHDKVPAAVLSGEQNHRVTQVRNSYKDIRKDQGVKENEKININKITRIRQIYRNQRTG